MSENETNILDEKRFESLVGQTNAMRVISTLESAGYEACFVGGCVRDAICDRVVRDFDIATSAHWEDVERVMHFAGMKVRRSGIKHGTVTVVVKNRDIKDTSDARYQAYEVTTYRKDASSSADFRHPDNVEFVTSIEEDLSRRDFTVNAMAYHPKRGLIDPFGGIDDIAKKTIRAVGEPRVRFREDALRILRAVRFSSELGFSIEKNTYEAMLLSKSLLLKISSERITQELDRLLLGDNVCDAIIQNVDVLSVVLPELVAMKGCPQNTKYHIFDVLEHSAHAVAYAPKTRLLRWAALLHDTGKPGCAFSDSCGVGHFYGHAELSARIAAEVLNRFTMSKAFKSDVVALVRAHNDEVFPTERWVRRRMSMFDGCSELLRDLLDLHRADMRAHAPEYSSTKVFDEAEAILDNLVAQQCTFTLRDLTINGHDVLALGVEPGRRVGECLNVALKAVLEDGVSNDRITLLQLVKKYLG